MGGGGFVEAKSARTQGTPEGTEKKKRVTIVLKLCKSTATNSVKRI
jgi:hypothetical protein